MKTYETSFVQIESIKAYFDDPSHKPEIQIANDKTQYAWQNMSNCYYTAQVLRDGPIHELPEKLDSAIGKIGVTFADGVSKTVDDYFDTSTMDAMIVLREGKVVYEKYKTMRPLGKTADSRLRNQGIIRWPQSQATIAVACRGFVTSLGSRIEYQLKIECMIVEIQPAACAFPAPKVSVFKLRMIADVPSQSCVDPTLFESTNWDWPEWRGDTGHQ